jgi:uncharacterized protein (DUF1778 family)
MSAEITIAVPEDVARDIARAAKAAGLTPEAFVADAAVRRARALAEAEAFFAERAKGADLKAFDRILKREGGEPPRPGDEIE